ncbi:MAG: SDR family NAD(P)-dependent oxidoreductase, partial [Solirubrobacterales bacterium]
IAHAHASGAKLEWESFFKGTGAKRVPLPTYPFQRQRYWLDSAQSGAGDPTAVGQAAADHPLLGAAVELAGPDDGGLLLTGRLALATHPWLADHVVHGAVLLPGTAFLELALRAAEQVGAEGVEELVLQAPLVLPEQGTVALQVTVSGPDENGRREIAVHSRPEGARDETLAGNSEWTCHAEGALSAELAPPPVLLDAWPPVGAEPLEVGYLYDLLAEHGLEYGPAFRGLTAAWRDGDELYAEVSLAEEIVGEASRFGIHPALLDAALHGMGIAKESSADVELPFSWSQVHLHTGGARELRVRLSLDGDAVAMQIADGAGAPVAAVGALAMRPLDLAQLQAPARKRQGLLGIEWMEVALTTPEAVAGREDGEHFQIERWRCEIEGDLPAAEAARNAVGEALKEIQDWLADESKVDSRLTLITEGAMVVREESPDPAVAAVWGLVRSAQSEHPGRFALIDTDGTEVSEEVLAAALAIGMEEPQLALRDGNAFAPRAMPAKDSEDSLIPPPGPWRLDARERGTLESLALVPSTQEPLGPMGVRVRMRAAGLNFRDVLAALGLYPGDVSIGGEGAGIVEEAGPEVTDLAPGDRVMGLIPGAFGPLAVSERDLLVRIPDGWSFEQAAAMPIAFATAHYGLLDLARLEKDERILIHAGAGGVGMAAIQIASHLGAEVFATASPSKWEVLEAMGLDEDHIASSRDLDFSDRFLEITEGEGVDVVLNALAGEFIDASLALLPRGGRFLEMGKADIRNPERLAEEHAGVSYLPFDLGEAGPRHTGEILAEVTSLVEVGGLRHLPTVACDLREAPRAFRDLREGRNVGKIVLTVPGGIDPERTVLVTGATGGVGALIARRLVESHSARHLFLVSLGGREAAGAQELQTELEELGAQVTIAACDVSDRGALEGLVDSIPAAHPLGAVVHCAGALADALVESLDSRQIDRVFAPKVDAAWNLHELTREAELSAFVLFSSVAGCLGGPGQANYAAANVFLDALAQKRRAEGLPATAIAWGLWERAGMASELAEADLARLRRGGFGPLG